MAKIEELKKYLTHEWHIPENIVPEAVFRSYNSQ